MEYTNFKKFRNLDEAQELILILKSHNFDYKVIELKPEVDLTFTGNIETEYWIQMKPNDIQSYEELVDVEALKNLDKINKDSYLNDFTNDELIEILQNPDEWDQNDYLYAKKLLIKRGIKISSKKLKEFKDIRLTKLSAPEKAHWAWIVVAYLFAFMGGFLGIILGWVFYSSKKTIHGGKKVFTYDVKTRLNGRIIFIIGILSAITWFLIYIISKL